MTTPHTSLIIGDRACGGCGFNMHHQRIEREPHYNLLIARCPECGTVTPMTEIPGAPKWFAWVAPLFALAWLSVALAAIAGSAMVLAAAVDAAADLGLRPVGTGIGRAHITWHKSTYQDQTAPAAVVQQMSWAQSGYSHGTYVALAWWNTQSQPAFYPDSGGDRAAIAATLPVSISVAPCLFVAGAGTAVLFLGARRRTLLALALLTVAAGTLGVWLINELDGKTALAYAPTGYSTAGALAREAFGLRIVTAAIFTFAAAYTLGVFTGRPLARWGVRLLLPPRSGAIFAFLWTADGLVFQPHTPSGLRPGSPSGRG
jgi:hypothetical protein